MNAYDAYRVTKRTLRENLNIDLIDDHYDEKLHGDFYLSFHFQGRNGSVITDRYQMFIADDLPFRNGKYKLLFPDMYSVSEQELVSILTGLFQSGRW